MNQGTWTWGFGRQDQLKAVFLFIEEGITHPQAPWVTFTSQLKALSLEVVVSGIFVNGLTTQPPECLQGVVTGMALADEGVSVTAVMVSNFNPNKLKSDI